MDQNFVIQIKTFHVVNASNVSLAPDYAQGNDQDLRTQTEMHHDSSIVTQDFM